MSFCWSFFPPSILSSLCWYSSQFPLASGLSADGGQPGPAFSSGLSKTVFLYNLRPWFGLPPSSGMLSCGLYFGFWVHLGCTWNPTRRGPDSHWGWVSEWSRAQQHLCCCCSVSKSCPAPWTAARQASLSFTIFWSLFKFMSIELVMPSNHLILCLPLLLPSIFPSIGVFSKESVLPIRWPKYWSFSISVSPSNECSGLISFRMDWLDRFAVQGTLKSLLQHHYLKASILWHSASLSSPYLPLYLPCLALVTVSETFVTRDLSSGISTASPSMFLFKTLGLPGKG